MINVVSDDVQTRAFSVSVDGVTAMDAWIEHVTNQWGLSERTAFGARLCIAELAANVLEHGIPQAQDDEMVLTIDRIRDGIEVELRDTRQAFDPTAGHGLPEDQANGGGRGLALIHAYARDLTYISDPEHNRIKFRIIST